MVVSQIYNYMIYRTYIPKLFQNIPIIIVKQTVVLILYIQQYVMYFILQVNVFRLCL